MTDPTPSATPGGRGPRYPDLAGRVAVVTGGSRGIGAQTARALAANGARGRGHRPRRAGAGRRGRHDHRRGRPGAGRARRLHRRGRGAARRDHDRRASSGPVDILAPFAGGNGMPVPTAEETVAHWREVVDSDLTSMFVCVRAFLPGMIERRRGAIITMASAAARQAAHSSAAYAAAKAGVIAFTRHLAAEVGPARHPRQLRRAVGHRERAHADLDDRGAARASWPPRSRCGGSASPATWPPPRCFSPRTRRRGSPASRWTSPAARSWSEGRDGHRTCSDVCARRGADLRGGADDHGHVQHRVTERRAGEREAEHLAAGTQAPRTGVDGASAGRPARPWRAGRRSPIRTWAIRRRGLGGDGQRERGPEHHGKREPASGAVWPPERDAVAVTAARQLAVAQPPAAFQAPVAG